MAVICRRPGRSHVGHFRRHLMQRYSILEMTPALLADAMTLARAHELRAYDGCTTGRRTRSKPHLSNGTPRPGHPGFADQALNVAAAANGVAVIDPHHASLARCSR